MPSPLIKICGLSTPETVDAAVAAGASHVGFVSFTKSPRHVSAAAAAELRARVPGHVQVVLLTVDADHPALAELVAAVRPDLLQLHGSENPADAAAIRATTGLEVWKALPVKDGAALALAESYVGAVDRILFDAPHAALPGGNGLVFNWQLLAGHRHSLPWGLAGGLTPANVADAVRQTGAPLVDTSSGVEGAPGVKDVDKIRAFCQSARHD